MPAFRDPPPSPPERPASPPASYGVPQQGGDLVDWRHVVQRLREATVYWLASVTPAGRPHVVPIWGALVEDDLYVETGAPDTAKVRNLVASPHVQVHLDDGDDVVIVAGTAEFVSPSGALADELCHAFAAKYPGYTPTPADWAPGGDGTLARIDPETVLAWRDMPTATRWRLTERTEHQRRP